MKLCPTYRLAHAYLLKVYEKERHIFRIFVSGGQHDRFQKPVMSPQNVVILLAKRIVTRPTGYLRFTCCLLQYGLLS